MCMIIYFIKYIYILLALSDNVYVSLTSEAPFITQLFQFRYNVELASSI